MPPTLDLFTSSDDLQAGRPPGLTCMGLARLSDNLPVLSGGGSVVVEVKKDFLTPLDEHWAV